MFTYVVILFSTSAPKFLPDYLEAFKQNLKSYLNSIPSELIICKSFELVEKYSKHKCNVSLLYVTVYSSFVHSFCYQPCGGIVSIITRFLDHAVHIQET